LRKRHQIETLYEKLILCLILTNRLVSFTLGITLSDNEYAHSFIASATLVSPESLIFSFIIAC